MSVSKKTIIKIVSDVVIAASFLAIAVIIFISFASSSDRSKTSNTSTTSGLSEAKHDTKNESIKIGFIGDSITVGGSGAPTAVDTVVSLLGDNYIAVNRAVGGSSTNDWLPGGQNYEGAVSDFKSQNVTTVSIMLGTNDAKQVSTVSAERYRSNLKTIIGGLLSTGRITQIILNYPPYVVPGALGLWDEDSSSRLESYMKQIDSLVNGTTVLQGDTASYAYFAAHPEELSDGVHPNAIGYARLGAFWAVSYTKLFAASQQRTSAQTSMQEQWANPLHVQ